METQLTRIADYLQQIAGGDDTSWLWEPGLICFGALLAFAGTFVASLFERKIGDLRDRKLRPRLRLLDDLDRRTAPTFTSEGLQTTYYRIPVENSGVTLADKCRALLWKAERLEDGTWRQLDYHDTMPLNWSYHHDDVAREGTVIPPGKPMDVDVVEAREGNSGLILKTKPEANRYDELVTDSGTYRFSVYITAENADPVDAVLCVNVPEDGGEPTVVPC